MSSPVVAVSPVNSSVQPGETPSTSIVAIPVYVQEASPISEAPNDSMPARPPGLPRDRVWPTHDDAYWSHLRDMWDATSNGTNSRRPSATSPVSSAFSDDASCVDLEDVDLRSATAQKVFRLNNLPTMIKAQTEAANKLPSTLDGQPEPGTPTLPVPPSFAGRRRFNGSVVTTRTTTRGPLHDPVPPYTRRPSAHEQSLGVNGYLVEHEEVSQVNKWTYWIPSCKWLFWIGFIFPLLWALGSVTLFFGVHPSSASSIESGTSKLSQFIKQAQIDEKHRIQNEKRWAKRCAWAFAFALCSVPVIVCMIVIAPHLNTPNTVLVFT